MINLVSWNVNGIRAIFKKKKVFENLSFIDWIKQKQPEILCIQETKAQKSDLSWKITKIPNYKVEIAEAKKKGYSGVLTYIHKKMGKYQTQIGFNKKFDVEGRTLITKFDQFILLNCYMPNGKRDEERLDYKMDYYKALAEYSKSVLKNDNNNIIICGDVNTAHHPIDLARPQQNEKISGFLPIEREWQTAFLNQGFFDSFRYLHPEKAKYSWWSYRAGAREHNIGWRIDYFYLSNNLKSNLKKAEIHNEIFGSDHCPISISLQF